MFPFKKFKTFNKTDLGGNTTYCLILVNKVLSFFLGFCLFAFNIRQTIYNLSIQQFSGQHKYKETLYSRSLNSLHNIKQDCVKKSQAAIQIKSAGHWNHLQSEKQGVRKLGEPSLWKWLLQSSFFRQHPGTSHSTAQRHYSISDGGVSTAPVWNVSTCSIRHWRKLIRHSRQQSHTEGLGLAGTRSSPTLQELPFIPWISAQRLSAPFLNIQASILLLAPWF